MYRKSYWKRAWPHVEYHGTSVMKSLCDDDGYICAHCGQWQLKPYRECPICGSLMVKEEIDIRG